MSSVQVVPRWLLASLVWSTITTNAAVAFVPTSTPTKLAVSALEAPNANTCRTPTRVDAVGDHDEANCNRHDDAHTGRRKLLKDLATGMIAASVAVVPGLPALASDEAALPPVELTPSSPDAKKLFNEGRALESQGNMAAAQRLYNKVTKISPRFVYGWSNLGNTQVAMGDLPAADINYSKAIELCRESSAEAVAQGFGIKKCNDLYVLLLNRGSVRLNTPGLKGEALKDLRQANTLRERPDAVILQNLARAEEMNGYYSMADKNYNLAISMTANEVNPFWLRSAMVKLQMGDLRGGRDLLKRVENRFPDAPEVKAASATFLWAQERQQQQPSAPVLAATTTASGGSTGEITPSAPKPIINYQIDAQRKFLEIPDRQRLRFIDPKYLEETIAWPPIMIEGVTSIARVVGDYKTVEPAPVAE